MAQEPIPDPAPDGRDPRGGRAADAPPAAPEAPAGGDPPTSIAAAALLRAGHGGPEVLIARRHPESVRGGLWEYPGGKVAPGETANEAAARELLEETGIAVDPSSGIVVARSSHEDPSLRRERSISIVLVRFACPPGAEPRPLASAECRWELVSRLDSYEWPAANRPLNDALRTSLGDGR